MPDLFCGASLIALSLLAFTSCDAFVTFKDTLHCALQSKSSDSDGDDDENSRRKFLTTYPIGAVGTVVYAKLVADSISKISLRGDLVYPKEHEERVSGVIQEAFARASSDTVRVLEVGIGSDWRVARRGLYSEALKGARIKKLKITGVDLDSVKDSLIVEDARRTLQKANHGIDVQVETVAADITKPLPKSISEQSFDVILCILTLCSVQDPNAAIQNLKSLAKPTTLIGFVEHVAADSNEYPVLSLQQQAFDPLQQIVAHNCHLRRRTDELIAEEFQSAPLDHFLVPDMWPVSYQCSGVIQA